MSDFMRLYRFEWKKLWKKKIVWIAVALLLPLLALSISEPLLGTYYVDGEKVDSYVHIMQVDKGYQLALDGRAVDQQLLEEMMAAYSKIPPDIARYSTTEEYQMYARPYSAVFLFACDAMGMDYEAMRQWTVSETDFYARWQTAQQEHWNRQFVTAGEQQFWLEQMQRLEQPLRYGYHEGYSILCSALYTIGTLLLVVITVCLSGFYPDEHTRRTDALLLCSKQGRRMLYWVKLAVGASFAAGLALLSSLFAFSLSFALYGAEGFDVAFQFVRARYLYPLSVGQAVLLGYGMLALGAVLTAVFVMVLSEFLHNSTATLAFNISVIILTMFLNLPEQYRVVAQLWDYLPSNFIAVWGIFSDWTIPIAGHYLTDWQAVPILYLGLILLLAFLGQYGYRRYQVQGR